MFVSVNSPDRLVVWFGGWDGSVTRYDVNRAHGTFRVRAWYWFWPNLALAMPFAEIRGHRVERRRNRFGLARYQHVLQLDRGRRLGACCLGKGAARKLVRLLEAFLKAE